MRTETKANQNPTPTQWKNLLYHGDNLAVLKKLQKNPDVKGKIQLIYIDPPFATARDFFGKNGEKSYSDKLVADKFLVFLEERLLLMKELLAKNGSIFVHLDQRMSHRVKLLLDDIFGEKNFRNEIIWNYVSGGISNKFFAKKHDSIFFYTTTDDYTFHPQKERTKSYKKSSILRDEKGEYVWYLRPNVNPSVPNGVKTYLDKYVQDVWDIPIVNPMAAERTGYPTQKPEPLLKRIILATTNKEDLVADFFAGSGTTGIVAEKLNRRWLMSDKGTHAIDVIKERLATIQTGYAHDPKKPTRLYTKPNAPYTLVKI
jgi:site-specific DNA-methyltransferase (adenine-specific)/adenine-specific DNA-methyltransferase